MRYTRLVKECLMDAADWVLEASQAPSERMEMLNLRKAHTAILWAERQIAARLITLEERKPYESAAQKTAFQAWEAEYPTKGQG